MRALNGTVAGAIVAALIATACATSTRLVSDWKDPEYTRTIESAMVIGVTEEATTRRLFEDELARQFAAKGVRALASNSVLPSDAKLERDVIKAEVDRLGIDAVLVTRSLRVETEEEYVPGTGTYSEPYAGLYSHYDRAYDEVNTSGYYEENTTYVLETNLYDAETEKVVWSGQSTTFNPANTETAVKDVGNVLVGTLVKQGLIR